jgi:hypothetical protein
VKVKRPPFTSTWPSRRVVRPNERFCFAYSSLPTRISVFSSNCTISAITFCRVRPMRRKSAAVRRRTCGSACAKPIIRSYFASSRTVRQFGW